MTSTLRRHSILPAINESQRLNALAQTGLLDSPPDPRFDALTRLAADLFKVPIALISLIDDERQWFKSRVGLGICETEREIAFCSKAIESNGVLVVPDTHSDPHFSANPLVVGPPYIRFYAGAVIYTKDRLPLGTICVMSPEPRQCTLDEQNILIRCAEMLESLIEADCDTTDCRGSISRMAYKLSDQSALTGYIRNAMKMPDLSLGIFMYRVLGGVSGGQKLARSSRLRSDCHKHVAQAFKDACLAHGRLNEDVYGLLFDSRKVPAGCATVLEDIADYEAFPTFRLYGTLIYSIPSATSFSSLISQLSYVWHNTDNLNHGVFQSETIDVASLIKSSFILKNLEAAIDNNAIGLAFSPVVDVRRTTDKTMLVSPLWKDEEGDLVDRDLVYSIAQYAGLSRKYSVYMLDRIFEFILDASVEGSEHAERYIVSLQGHELSRGDWLKEMVNRFRRYPLPVGSLRIAVNSAIPPASRNLAKSQMEELHSRFGVEFIYDGYGEDVGALQLLFDLPFKGVCLGSELVERIDSMPGDASAFSQSVVGICRHADCFIMAKNITTERQFITLSAMGCDYYEGPLIGDPAELPFTP
ncbi:EAL domain-containing protein (putative c-di-GMP-specific phosphodiesterase class I) [Litorivivens lipolytica]|uniref:EAL domain-containing protein (Putative c-di-GMP-specific phosphodiesterase class I) n=1 Tax=Litorivivens lipolytica TaxID=1524264 RepID=A0A7W4W841_9GAMM|nr:EAL domain-containing protein [Litorivivens lipolytica]MBB3048748.1 EAL domain-containing protein (putative c-di-GMP-specific phosphodiesterase class I) [Litorivivens lipolytica]